MITLRAINSNDLGTLAMWRNQLMEEGSVRQWRYLNEIDQDRWLESVTGDGSKHQMLMIVANDGAAIVGVCGLCYIDWPRRRAEASLYIGGEGDRKKGYGEAALRALLNYGFGTLGFRCIWAEIFATNEKSLGLFKKVGFLEEGLLRSRHFHGGQWIDSWSLSILDREWKVT